MLPTVADGENFAMRPIQRGWLHHEIWQRPDLSRAEGALLAARMAELIQRFATEYTGLLFDMRRATPVWGPVTDEAIARMFAPWEALGKPLIIVPANEAIQQIALRKLLASNAPRQGRIVDDFDVAMAEIEVVHSVGSGPRSQGPRSQGPRSQGPRSQGPVSLAPGSQRK